MKMCKKIKKINIKKKKNREEKRKIIIIIIIIPTSEVGVG